MWHHFEVKDGMIKFCFQVYDTLRNQLLARDY